MLTMVSEVTEGIEVQVRTSYEERFSHPKEGQFVFSYDITIINASMEEVQLLRRKWYTVDATGEVNIVQGDGVVGLQPVLNPGESHNYQSGTHFHTPIGKMSGTYTFKRLKDGAEFEVVIPEFRMAVPFVLN